MSHLPSWSSTKIRCPDCVLSVVRIQAATEKPPDAAVRFGKLAGNCTYCLLARVKAPYWQVPGVPGIAGVAPEVVAVVDESPEAVPWNGPPLPVPESITSFAVPFHPLVWSMRQCAKGAAACSPTWNSELSVVAFNPVA